jgi:hypothetical protein
MNVRTVVLVEGFSDRLAVEALARRLGRDLVSDGIAVLPIGGATNIGAFVRHLGRAVALAGPCDAGEERHFRRALEDAGLGTELTRAGMHRIGFFVCEADLEDELIRALGSEAMESVIAAAGELRRFRTFQKQPAQRQRPIEAQLRRFIGTASGRKERYAPVLVDALDLAHVPQPLSGLLDHLARTGETMTPEVTRAQRPSRAPVP